MEPYWEGAYGDFSDVHHMRSMVMREELKEEEKQTYGAFFSQSLLMAAVIMDSWYTIVLLVYMCVTVSQIIAT